MQHYSHSVRCPPTVAAERKRSALRLDAGLRLGPQKGLKSVGVVSSFVVQPQVLYSNSGAGGTPNMLHGSIQVCYRCEPKGRGTSGRYVRRSHEIQEWERLTSGRDGG